MTSAYLTRTPPRVFATAEHLEGLINEFLGELQERDRNIFLQRYWFATPIKEISKKYAMNLNTVKASLFRSRNKLKALLEKEGVLL